VADGEHGHHEERAPDRQRDWYPELTDLPTAVREPVTVRCDDEARFSSSD